MFDSTGWALEDHIIMQLFMDIAQELGLGTKIPIENFSKDPKNPYHFINVAATV
ncbi:MAG: hypothetical protein GKR88_16730 [Flavobacteriaceae bacterium]|nr:MAG: hypothetical protein GKR88_16730 [Flavobacteriaceae bacterium]